MTPAWMPAEPERDELELLLDAVLTPAELTLTVPTHVLTQASGAIELTDPEGTPIARAHIVEHHRLDDEQSSLTATVEPLRPREDGLFRNLRRSPAEVRAQHRGERLLAVPFTAPLDTAAIEEIRSTARDGDHTLLLPLNGTGSSRVVSGVGLVQSAIAATELLPVPTSVVPVPLASVGDPAADSDRAQRVADAYGDATLRVDPPPERVEQLTRALDDDAAAAALPAGLVPDPIANVLRMARPASARRGLTLLFTGLSGSGKSTVARRVQDLLLARGDRTVTMLDGDIVRRMLSAGLGFSRSDREMNVRRIGYVAAEAARHGGIALCAPIAPYAAVRADVRHMVEAAGGDFILIHVNTPLAVCEQRDRKGLYAKARAGEITEFTGVSDPYEEPEDAELALDTSQLSIAEAAQHVIDLLVTRGSLR